MKNLATAIALAAALCAAPAFAASHKEAPDMKAASGAAGMKSGDAAMGAASGGGRIVGAGANAKVTGTKPPGAQQAKMASCNKEAKAQNLKGDERKTFMKGCLSNTGEMQQGASTMQQDKPKP